ncbi:MAG: polysaccharide deacetylase family protein [Cyclobacteriaceae bacterium]|nr:polysaccharide deacetylase family protein [Cyclobacteriaceae bacterium]
MVIHKVPSTIQAVFPKREWKIPTERKTVFLTFDDGPVPGATDFVLNELAKRNQQATFFVVGDNVRKHANLAKTIIQSAHQIGNHTYHHLKGWKTDLEAYLQDVELCDQVLEEKLGLQTKLFRPPYGQLRPSQAKELLKTRRVIMWDVLSGDYDFDLNDEQVIKGSTEKMDSGSIVVFHDQEKTQERLIRVLPTFLDYLVDRGWKTELL